MEDERLRSLVEEYQAGRQQEQVNRLESVGSVYMVLQHNIIRQNIGRQYLTTHPANVVGLHDALGSMS